MCACVAARGRLSALGAVQPKAPPQPDGPYVYTLHKRMTGSQRATFRKQLLALPNLIFTNRLDVILNYEPVRQASNNACLFAGLLMLVRLSGQQLGQHFGTVTGCETEGLSHAQLCRNWENTHRALRRRCGVGMRLAEMLDAATAMGLLQSTLHVEYTPVRAGDRIGRDFVEPGAVVSYIKRRVLCGVPVLLDTAQHARVCIGYNCEEFILADVHAESTDKMDRHGSCVKRTRGGFGFVPQNTLADVVVEMACLETPRSLFARLPE